MKEILRGRNDTVYTFKKRTGQEKGERNDDDRGADVSGDRLRHDNASVTTQTHVTRTDGAEWESQQPSGREQVGAGGGGGLCLPVGSRRRRAGSRGRSAP